MVKLAIQTYKLKQKLESFGGDCLLNAMGHTHRLLVYEPVDEMFLRDRAGQREARYTSSIGTIMHDIGYIPPTQRWYANTGGFLKLYSREAMSGYAEIGMYPPIEVGFIKVRVRNGKLLSVEKIYV